MRDRFSTSSQFFVQWWKFLEQICKWNGCSYVLVYVFHDYVWNLINGARNYFFGYGFKKKTFFLRCFICKHMFQLFEENLSNVMICADFWTNMSCYTIHTIHDSILSSPVDDSNKATKSLDSFYFNRLYLIKTITRVVTIYRSWITSNKSNYILSFTRLLICDKLCSE